MVGEKPAVSALGLATAPTGTGVRVVPSPVGAEWYDCFSSVTGSQRSASLGSPTAVAWPSSLDLSSSLVTPRPVPDTARPHVSPAHRRHPGGARGLSGG